MKNIDTQLNPVGLEDDPNLLEKGDDDKLRSKSA